MKPKEKKEKYREYKEKLTPLTTLLTKKYFTLYKTPTTGQIKINNEKINLNNTKYFSFGLEGILIKTKNKWCSIKFEEIKEVHYET